MRFPSFSRILDGARNATLRFPAAIACALFVVVAALFAFEETTLLGWDTPQLVVLIRIALLGLLASLAAAVYAERADWSRPLRAIAQAAVLAVLMLYAFVSPSWPTPASETQMSLFAIALAMACVFAPFLRGNEENGIWQYNRKLAQRALVTALYTFAVTVGLQLALLAVNSLFDLHVKPIRYPELMTIAATLTASFVFFAGVPERVGELEREQVYPKGLRIFAANILLPLVALYLLILYAYMIKSVVTWSMPKGYAGLLVAFFSSIGIATLLLLVPIMQQGENRFARLYSRVFHPLLYPLIAFMAVAIWLRVQQYGVTEMRYFLIVAAAWLLYYATVQTFGRLRHLRTIPLTIAVLSVLAAFGPWGASSIAVHSQTARLRGLLEQNKMLVDGKLVRVANVPDSARREISAATSFLVEHRAMDDLRAWCGGEVDSLAPQRELTRSDERESASRVVALLGTTYLEPFVDRRSEGTLTLTQSDSVAINIGGFRDAFLCDFWGYEKMHASRIRRGGDGTRWRVGVDDSVLRVVHLVADSAHDRGELNIGAIVRAWSQLSSDSVNVLDTTLASAITPMRISFRSILVEREQEAIRLKSVRAWIMVRPDSCCVADSCYAR